MLVNDLEFLDLNQENVLTLYKECLIPKSDVGINPDDECKTKIFSIQSCGKDSPEVVFNKKKIEDNTEIIEHWLGQLKVSHDSIKGFTLPMGFINYNNETWTKDNTTLMALYYLAIASKSLPIFTKLPDSTKVASSALLVEPSLSPKDSNFKNLYDIDEGVIRDNQ